MSDATAYRAANPEFCLSEHEAWVVSAFLQHYMQPDDLEGGEIAPIAARLYGWCKEHPDL